jgi:hypothetical protein
MTGLRPIASTALADLEPGGTPRAKPIFEWVAPTRLLVDEGYQRNLGERSMRLIRKIVSNWDWARFKPPVCVLTDAGLECLDGQTTAIAAATHPDIDQIPVMIVEATERADRAAAFIGHNVDRVTVTATQIHAAAVTAGDEAAVAIERACEAAGVTILKAKPGSGFKPGQTVAVAAIGAVVARRGEEEAARYLRILVEAGAAPVAAHQIKAVEALLTDEEFETLDPDHLAGTIRSLGADGEREAKAFSVTHGLPLWKGLASIWFRKCRKRRASPVPPRSEPCSSPADRPAVKIAGDPAPVFKAARGGWKPGVHARRCRTCDETFTGHKDATECAACAYREEAVA